MRSTFRLLVSVVAVGALLAGAVLYGLSPSQPSLPEDFKQALRLLPTDVESVAGTLKPFLVDRSDKKGTWFTKSDAMLSINALLDLSLAKVTNGEAFRAALAGIDGREALWAIAAKRKQELRREKRTSMIVLGMHPYENITIIKFRSALPAALEQALAWSSSVEALPRGGRIFRQEHSPVAALLPKPDLLILVTMIGSDDGVLKALLHRLESPATDYALEDAGRAWALTDLDASLWSIRRTSDGKPGRRQDRVGRDWVVFAYDNAAPNRALFRSVRTRWPWRGQVAQVQANQEPVPEPTVNWGGGYADTVSECPPGTGLQCFMYSFAVDALGIMIWV